MTKRNHFTHNQIQLLESNPNVVHISESNVTYTSEFKLFAVKCYTTGKTPTQIFIEAGFDVKVIGTKNPKRCLKRRRQSYESYGEDGLLEDRETTYSTSHGRGKTNASRSED
jgi:transposase